MFSKYFQNNNVQKKESIFWTQKRKNEAPLAQICAICLDNNSKLYMMNKFQLAEKYENLTGHSLDDNKHLPQTLCIECTQRLIRCSQFRDKCLRARALMLDLLKDNEALTIQNIKLIDRDKNLLKSSLVHEMLIPNQFDLYIIDERDDGDAESVTEELKQELDVTIDTENMFNESNCVDINNDVGADISCFYDDAADNADCGASYDSDDCLSHVFSNIKYRGPYNFKKFDAHNTSVSSNVPDSANPVNYNDDNNEIFNKKSKNIHKINVKRDTKSQTTKNLNSYKRKTQKINKKASEVSEVDENRTNNEADIKNPVMSEDASASENGIKSFDLEGITKREIRIKLTDIAKSNSLKMVNKAKGPNEMPLNKRKPDATKTAKRKKKVNNTTKIRISSVKWVKINDEKTMYSESIVSNKEKSASKVTESKLFVCDHCQKVFYQRKLIVKHLRTSHTDRKAHTCSYCGYRCLFNSTLVRHIRIHTGEKPFACNLCDYRCPLSNQLKRHMNTRHSTAKPYLCHVCSYASKDQSTLKKHMITHRVDKPYSCQLCNFKCKSKALLANHIKIHSTEKRYACELCEYRCKRVNMLRKHMAIHTGKKPFSCSICPYRCANKFNLTKHMLKHTGEKPFKCESCPYEAKVKVFLTKHKDKCHI